MPTSTRRFTFRDLIALPRASEPVVSPDGKFIVFVSAKPNLDDNKTDRQLVRVPVAGGAAEPLTLEGTSSSEPAFSPDGKHLAFTSTRSGTPQIWLLPTAGGEARQVTRLRLGAHRAVWHPDGKQLLATSAVYGDSSDPVEIDRREDERKKWPDMPRVADELMFRHWDTWRDGKVDHLFIFDIATGAARDLTPGPYPVPPLSLTGHPDYAISPDGREVCFVSLRDDAQALSTNANLWTVAIGGGEPRRISPWAGCNAFPVYSPDGERIAYCGMRRPGYEADRRELLVFSRKSGATLEIAPGFDRSVGPPQWSPDGLALYFSAEDLGRTRLWRVPSEGGKPEPLTSDANDARPCPTPDGNHLIFSRQTMHAPPEIYRVASGGGVPTPLTAMSRDLLQEIELGKVQDFWYEGAGAARIHGLLLTPPGFDPEKRYPVLFVIHGGPQGAFALDFHERWNAQLFAAPGYVVVMINPRGSTGYGQAFTDAIRGEWGGACYEDLTRGFDHVLTAFPFCDPARTAAAGASFGGFMVNWIAGQTDRFRCLVSHDGMFNLEMTDYATDELWFTEWEFRGAPWESPEEYRKWSPHLHVQNMKTPMLVIHGEQDFRCVVGEGLNLFSALRRRGVPARFLHLPGEGHWVLKPKDREVWWREVMGWLDRYLGDAKTPV